MFESTNRMLTPYSSASRAAATTFSRPCFAALLA
jgi:hypothetical protein